MARKKREPSADAMIRLFIQKYNIATTADINRLVRKIEDLEKRLSKMSGMKTTAPKTKKRRPASEIVLDVIKDIKDGASVADIKEQTGYEDKKVRNILNRLNKEKKIKRKKRGVYEAA